MPPMSEQGPPEVGKIKTLKFPRPCARIAELWVYPIKACGGTRVEASQLGMRGLEHDRRYALIEAPDEGASKPAVVVTLRHQSRLSQVTTRLVASSEVTQTSISATSHLIVV